MRIWLSIFLSFSSTLVSMSAFGSQNCSTLFVNADTIADTTTNAENALGRKVTDEEQSAIWLAHNVGNGEVGADGSPARLGNYTAIQIAAKARLLSAPKTIGISERRELMRSGVVGFLGRLEDWARMMPSDYERGRKASIGDAFHGVMDWVHETDTTLPKKPRKHAPAQLSPADQYWAQITRNPNRPVTNYKDVVADAPMSQDLRQTASDDLWNGQHVNLVRNGYAWPGTIVGGVASDGTYAIRMNERASGPLSTSIKREEISVGGTHEGIATGETVLFRSSLREYNSWPVQIVGIEQGGTYTVRSQGGGQFLSGVRREQLSIKGTSAGISTGQFVTVAGEFGATYRGQVVGIAMDGTYTVRFADNSSLIAGITFQRIRLQ